MTDTHTLVTSEPSPPRKSFVSPLLVLLILVISAWIQFTVVTHTSVDGPLRGDARDYFFYAYNLADSGTYSRSVVLANPPEALKPDSLRTPGYPLFLAALGNPEPTPKFVRKVVLAQAGLAVLSVLLFYLIVRRFLDPGWSHAATLLTALGPHLAMASTYLLTETLFTCFLFASILGLIHALQHPSIWRCLVSGLLWGLCSLVRPTTQFLPPLLLILTLLPGCRAYLRPVAMVLLGFLLAQAPWQIRNLSLPSDLVQKNMTASFLTFGAYPGFMYENDPETLGYPYRFDPNADRDEADVRSALTHIAKRFREKPLEYSYWYLIGKPVFFLSWSNPDGNNDLQIFPLLSDPYSDDARFRAIRAVMLFLHWPLMLLGLTGAFVALFFPGKLGLDSQQQPAARVVAGVFCYALVFHMIGAPLPRYGIPFRPLLYPMAILILLALKGKIHGTPLAADTKGKI